MNVYNYIGSVNSNIYKQVAFYKQEPVSHNFLM